jgi:hypothetical protein
MFFKTRWLDNSQMNLGKTADKPKRDRKTKQPIFKTSYLNVDMAEMEDASEFNF